MLLEVFQLAANRCWQASEKDKNYRAGKSNAHVEWVRNIGSRGIHVYVTYAQTADRQDGNDTWTMQLWAVREGCGGPAKVRLLMCKSADWVGYIKESNEFLDNMTVKELRELEDSL